MARLKMHAYRAHGLTIHSEVECPAWVPTTDAGTADIRVVRGPVPPTLGPEARHGHKFQALGREVLLQTQSIADYLIRDGLSIVVEPKPASAPYEVGHLLAGWAIGAILAQRGGLGLHSCAVEREGRAFLVCADSGVGKSTTAWMLLQRGFRLLDDNLAAMDGVTVHPGGPEIKLWKETVAALGATGAEPFSQTTPVKLRSRAEDRWCPEPRPLHRVYVLEPAADWEAQPLRGGARLGVLTRHVFCRRFFRGTPEEKHLTQRLFWLADRTFVTKIRFPRSGAERLADYIEEEACKSTLRHA